MRADCGRRKRSCRLRRPARSSQSRPRNAVRAALGHPDLSERARCADRWRRSRRQDLRRNPSIGFIEISTTLRRRCDLWALRASLIAIEASQGLTRAGSRRERSLRHAIAQAACTDSSAATGSPVTTWQMRRRSSWWRATSRSKAASSPVAAASTSPAPSSMTDPIAVVMSYRHTARVKCPNARATAPAPNRASG